MRDDILADIGIAASIYLFNETLDGFKNNQYSSQRPTGYSSIIDRQVQGGDYLFFLLLYY